MTATVKQRLIGSLIGALIGMIGVPLLMNNGMSYGFALLICVIIALLNGIAVVTYWPK